MRGFYRLISITQFKSLQVYVNKLRLYRNLNCFQPLFVVYMEVLGKSAHKYDIYAFCVACLLRKAESVDLIDKNSLCLELLEHVFGVLGSACDNGHGVNHL